MDIATRETGMFPYPSLPPVAAFLPVARNMAAGLAALFLLPLAISAEASGQRVREAKGPAPATVVAAPPMVFGPMRSEGDVTASATIQVRPLDVGTLAPSAFGDWDHPAIDDPKQ